jgi:hypothetical protein
MHRAHAAALAARDTSAALERQLYQLADQAALADPGGRA